jgi:uracil-DNA glycosylase family 4
VSSIDKDCKDCGLYKKAKTVCMRGTGATDAQIVVIGNAPSALGDRRAEPIVGDPGRILKTQLSKHGLMGKTYITNLIKCAPPQDYDITPADIKACRRHLEKELEDIKPEFVVTLGVNPTKTLFRGKAKINQVHGEFVENDKVDYIGMPMFDPAYTLRDMSKVPGFENDWKRLAKAARGEKETSSVEWGVVRRGNLKQFLKEFEAAKEFAFDLETSGLFQFGGFRYITAIGIALPKKAWVIPGWMHPDFQHYSHSPWVHGNSLQMLMDMLFDLAESGKKKAYAHNGKFDNLWLMNMFGRKFRLDFDTMLAHHALDENNYHDLTSLCRTYLHEPEYDIPLANKNGKSKKPGLNYKYCAQDVAYTLRLQRVFKRELKQDKLTHRLFWSLTMPAARAMEDIEMNGLTIDLEEMDRIETELVTQKVQLRRALNKMAGDTVNWNSPPQIGQALFQTLGIKPTILTPKGLPSTSEEALLELMGKHEAVDMLLEYRKVTKFLSTYIHGFKDKMVGDKLYISFKLHGTVTGRYSSALHSIPRDGRVRNLVTAPEGWSFVQGDIATAELRVIAEMSGDPEMRYCFKHGIDLHWRTLMDFLVTSGGGDYLDALISTVKEHTGKEMNVGKAAEELLTIGHETAIQVWSGWKEGRKKAKAINFGYVYGMYPKKFIQTAKTKYGWEPTMAEAEEARAGYFRLYSGLLKWHERQKKLARVDGFVRTTTGRKRRLPGIYSKDRGIRSEAERQAINAPVQGTIGDYKAMVLVDIHENCDPEKLKVVGEHHDAVLMIVRNDSIHEVLPQALAALRRPKLMDVFELHPDIPMDGELEIGNWGAGVEYQALD